MSIQALSPAQVRTQRFHTIVFSGGGNRCWWQAGLVETLAQHPCWQAQRLIGASAGAGIATAFATGGLRNALQAAVARFNATPRNVEWSALLRGQRPFVMPRIYPDWLDSFLCPERLAQLQQQALQVEVVITRPLRGLPVTLSTLLALALYSSEKYWLKNFHSRLPHRLGLRAQHLGLHQCADFAEARNLLQASAAAVPITPVHKVEGRAALDGGFYDSVPLPQDRNHDANTLVLLTRHRPELPTWFRLQQRTYWQPQAPVAAKNFDCTDGAAVRASFDQGQREALATLGG